MECEVNAFELSIRPAAKWFKYRIDFIASLDNKDKDLTKGMKNE